jgi:hypothetical protein
MIYDLRPGELVQTPDDRILDEDEVDAARAKLEKGARLETVARQLGATVWTPDEPEPSQHVAVPFDALVATLGEEKARELAGLPPQN